MSLKIGINSIQRSLSISYAEVSSCLYDFNLGADLIELADKYAAMQPVEPIDEPLPIIQPVDDQEEKKELF